MDTRPCAPFGGIEQFATIPIIAVTGKVMAGERERCLDAGANDYVPKPINTTTLLAAVKPWLVVREPVSKSVPSAEAQVEAVPITVPDLDSTEEPIADGPTILVVDDDFRNTFALSALLERGHIVVVAESGPDALSALARTPNIDVVLMDIMMPVMDGYDTIRAMRATDHVKELPIIAVTGKVMPGERERCIEAGANDYVPKPVDSAELFAALRPWLPTTVQSTAA